MNLFVNVCTFHLIAPKTFVEFPYNFFVNNSKNVCNKKSKNKSFKSNKSSTIDHNRHVGKLYASSAFFTPGLHPTVEDQVELARRISSSLSDANNKLSKGQTMYTNRKKRSVKWVHEGEGISLYAHMCNCINWPKWQKKTIYKINIHFTCDKLVIVKQIGGKGKLPFKWTFGQMFQHFFLFKTK